MQRHIDVLVFDGVNLLDVAGPVQAFEAAVTAQEPAYVHRFVSADGGPVRASCGLTLGVDGALSAKGPADDILIPGGDVAASMADPKTLGVLRDWHAGRRNGRLISICSGALILAAAGVLDGRSATTHWSRAKDITRFERVDWCLDRIWTRSAEICTSAGVTTGIDLALAIIREDCGNDIALKVACELVVHLRRTGGQSQFVTHLAGQFTPDDHLARLVEEVITAPASDWTLDQLAETAGMNTRTLSRRFNTVMNTTPARFVERVRVDHARTLLAEQRPLKQVATASGFGDYQRMRRAFQRQLRMDPSAYADHFA